MARLLESLDRGAALVWVNSYPGIEVGGVFLKRGGGGLGLSWVADGLFVPLPNESVKDPDRLYSCSYETVSRNMEAYGGLAAMNRGIFFHSHPGGAIPSRTDFDGLALMKEWFGLSVGLVYACAGEDRPAAWYLYDEDDVLEVTFE